MQIFTSIAGHAGSEDTARSLHALEHSGLVDWLYLAPADLSRRRLRATTVGGREVAIALPRDARLHDGAVLHLDASGALVVRVDAESWLRVRPTSAEAGLKLGYHAGNLHWRVAFCDGDLLVALEHRVEIYLDRLKDLIAAGSVRILDQETRS